MRILDTDPYDVLATEQFQRLKAQKVKLGTMDLKIATIVLRHNATLLSANIRDFRQVPNLAVEDWLIEEGAGHSTDGKE
jgi:tRNA(fMet)-specific endonuclease VapC